jgi:hypothetical protein
MITLIKLSMRVGLGALSLWLIQSWDYRLRLTKQEMIFAKTPLENRQNSLHLLMDGTWTTWMGQCWKSKRVGLGLQLKVDNITSGDTLITTTLVDLGYGLKRLHQEIASSLNITQSLDLTNFDDFIDFEFIRENTSIILIM